MSLGTWGFKSPLRHQGKCALAWGFPGGAPRCPSHRVPLRCSPLWGFGLQIGCTVTIRLWRCGATEVALDDQFEEIADEVGALGHGVIQRASPPGHTGGDSPRRSALNKGHPLLMKRDMGCGHEDRWTSSASPPNSSPSVGKRDHLLKVARDDMGMRRPVLGSSPTRASSSQRAGMKEGPMEVAATGQAASSSTLSRNGASTPDNLAPARLPEGWTVWCLTGLVLAPLGIGWMLPDEMRELITDAPPHRRAGDSEDRWSGSTTSRSGPGPVSP